MKLRGAEFLCFDTEDTETPPSPKSRLLAIDGGVPTPDFKPSSFAKATEDGDGLNRRRRTTVTLRVFRSRGRHEILPSGERHGASRVSIHPCSSSAGRISVSRGSRKPKVDVGASDSGRAFILRSLGVGGCSSPLTLAPTSIARQGDSASPEFPRFPCQNYAIRHWRHTKLSSHQKLRWGHRCEFPFMPTILP